MKRIFSRAQALLFLFFAQCCPLLLNAQSFPQWGNLQPGPYTVGYRTIRLVDHARTYTVKDGVRVPRPLQIYLWYPAIKTDKSRMPFGDYFNDVGFDQAGYKDPEVLKNYVLTEFRNGPLFPSYNQALTPEIYNKITGTLTACVREAEPLPGKFPLVLHFPGSVNQSVLIEFLVSHGYVVASLPLIGSSPATYGRGDASKASSLIQIEDLQFAFRELSKEKFVDYTKSAMIGMFAQLGLELQMKDQLFSSLACLDCDLEPAELKSSPHFDARRVTIPFLQLLNTDHNQLPSITDSLSYMARYKIDFGNLPHADFYPFKRIAKPETSLEDKNYEYISKITLNFLNATIKNDKQAEKELLNNLNLPTATATISVRQPLPAAATEQEFLTWLREGEIEKAKAAYANQGRTISSQDPFFFSIVFLARDRAPHAWETLKMFVDAYPGHPRVLRYLNIYGYYFLNQGYNLKEAKIAFETMLRDYPESPYAHDAWADYLIEVGRGEEALTHSEKAISLTHAAQLPQAEKDGLIKSAEQRIERIKGVSKQPVPFTAGNFTVGFKSIQTKAKNNDPTTIGIWYPSTGSKSMMSLRDYVLADARDKSSSDEQRLTEFKGIAERIYNVSLSNDQIANGFVTKGLASRDAKIKPGKFPLIIASGAPAYYHEIFESLASHGFVIASTTTNFSTPSPDPDSPDHYTRYTDALRDLKEYMSKQPYVDTTNITAFGHGGGIQAGMYLAMRSKSVKRVINLDGGFFGPRSKTTNSRDYNPVRFNTPLLHIITASQNAEDDAQQFSAIKTPITKVTVTSKAVRHHDFTSWKKLTEFSRIEDERKIVDQTLNALTALMLQFLNGKPIEEHNSHHIKVEKFNP